DGAGSSSRSTRWTVRPRRDQPPGSSGPWTVPSGRSPSRPEQRTTRREASPAPSVPSGSEAGLDDAVAAADEGAGAVADGAGRAVCAVDVVEVDARHSGLLRGGTGRGEPLILDRHIQGRPARGRQGRLAVGAGDRGDAHFLKNGPPEHRLRLAVQPAHPGGGQLPHRGAVPEAELRPGVNTCIGYRLVSWVFLPSAIVDRVLQLAGEQLCGRRLEGGPL